MRRVMVFLACGLALAGCAGVSYITKEYSGVDRTRAEDLAPVIAELRAAGVASLRGLAAALTARSIPTASGNGKWSAVQVGRVLERLA